tara:strand:- start:271 stop:1140 length:870 start_codon:yes stop_codon:yes gene_type:complete
MANGNDNNQNLTGFQGLFGNIVIPGATGTPSNKQIIDAAILRTSLELLKPRQPSENFASQLGRGITAATEFGESIAPDLDQQIKALELEKLRKEVEGRDEPIERTVTDRNIERDALADQAFGFGDYTTEVLGGVGRFFGQDITPETTMAIRNIQGLNRDLLKGAASEVSGRPSVYYLELSRDELPEPGFTSTDADALRKYETLQERYRGQLDKNIQALESAKRRGDNSKIFKIEQAIADQKYYVDRLEGVTRSLREDLGYGPKIQSDFTTTKPIENQDIDSVLDDFQRR